MAPANDKPDDVGTEMEGATTHQDAIDTLKQVEVESGEQAAHYEHFIQADQDWHRAMTKKLMRKVDLHLLPMLSLMYLLNFLDRK